MFAMNGEGNKEYSILENIQIPYIIMKIGPFHISHFNLQKIFNEWLTSEFFAVGIFSFAGVALRISIQYSLEGNIEKNTITNYGPFIQIFYSQTYLACNLLGCFIMAICIDNMNKVLKLNPPLYKGLTTGIYNVAD